MKATKISGCIYSALILMLLAFVNQPVSAQSQTPLQKRLERFTELSPKLIYPLIKGGPLSGVIPVEILSNKISSRAEVKLLFDFKVATSSGMQATGVNEGLEEMARILNLHIAAGVKKENLTAVAVFHSNSVFSLTGNAYYQKIYQTNNPNIPIIQQMQQAGVLMIVCGQTLAVKNVLATDLYSSVQVAYSAKTTLTKYQLMDYIVFEINDNW